MNDSHGTQLSFDGQSDYNMPMKASKVFPRSETLSVVVVRGNSKNDYILTMNKLKTLHHMAYNQNQQYWREHFKMEALRTNWTREQPYFAWANITVDHIKPTQRNIDIGACMPVVKAGIDGIVLAGILVDDTPEYVRSLTFNPPDYQQGIEAIVLTLRGPRPETTVNV